MVVRLDPQNPAGAPAGAGTSGSNPETVPPAPSPQDPEAAANAAKVAAFAAQRSQDQVEAKPEQTRETWIDQLLEDRNIRRIRNFFIRLERATHPSVAPPAIVVHDDLEPQFLVFGDSGTGDKHQMAVAKGMEKFCAGADCKFALMTGDNFYRYGISSPTSPDWDTKFEKPYAKLDLPFFPSLGNHDHWGSTSAQVERSKLSKKWVMPAPYHAFAVGHGGTKTEVFALDTEVLDKAQLDWLDASLAKSTAPWKVVYGHHPIFSSGEHGNNADLQRDLLPMLQKHGVDAYITGHDHDLEVITKDGLVFAISGGAAKLRAFETPTTESEFAAETRGFMHVAIDATGLRLRVMDQDGAVLFDKTFTKAGAATQQQAA